MLKFSIITCTYNSEETVAKTIESVVSQTYIEYEHIFIDGLSRDGTLQIVDRYFQIDPRVKKISEKDSGIYEALNKGLLNSSGDVICFLHSDDIFADSSVLQRVADLFGSAGAPDIVYGDLIYTRKKSDSTFRRWLAHRRPDFNYKKLITNGWMPPHPAVFAKRACYIPDNLFDSSYRISADYKSLIVFFYFSRFVSSYIPKVLVKMSVGGVSNRSFYNILLKTKEDYNVLKQCGFGIFIRVKILVYKYLTKLPQLFSR